MKEQKYIIVKKAWFVRHMSFDWDQYEIVYANNANQAKATFEKINRDYKYSENFAKRAFEQDFIVLDGLEGRKHIVFAKIEQNNRYQKIKNLPNEGTLYIIKNDYVGNALLCWGHNGSGYTSIWENIGQYTKTDLLRIFEKGIREQDVIYPVADILPGLKTIIENQYIKHDNRI